ncbi:hypothetical protein HYX19_04080 [Candidatus Woesearchaeota archaeon]|nr:hypothetical protein [Candidatus Woesearchaeota archaeon]
MATITINIGDDVDREFRETVKEKMGQHKGTLGKAIEEAIKKWIEEKKQKKIAERQLNFMDKGLYSLKGWKFSREEIYERY